VASGGSGNTIPLGHEAKAQAMRLAMWTRKNIDAIVILKCLRTPWTVFQENELNFDQTVRDWQFASNTSKFQKVPESSRKFQAFNVVESGELTHQIALQADLSDHDLNELLRLRAAHLRETKGDNNISLKHIELDQPQALPPVTANPALPTV
jgi:hypothetical protein